MMTWPFIHAYLLAISFVVSALLTALMRRVALRWQILDHPGERKMQKSPVALLGGVAIGLTVYLVVGGHLLALTPLRRLDLHWLSENILSFLGEDVALKLLGLALGGLIVIGLGVVDDIRRLSPEMKLAGQALAAGVAVLCGIRLNLFIETTWLTEYVPAAVISIPLTFCWIILITNAMNLLDNMDGLSAGVAAIAAVSFYLAVDPRDTFVLCLLMVFAGSAAGFLYHNFNPARIYMGDAGSLFCGYALACVAVLGTFHHDASNCEAAVFAPLIALSVPLFDTLSVVWIRWRRGESIMKGDKRHFSHRLVDMGMSPARAVEFIYLVAALTGLGAALLRKVELEGTLIILGQVLGVFALIGILMRVANGGNGQAPADETRRLEQEKTQE
jgi:UDP-GlcNAc:undecaprenyl-phosphate GlcNAc-1-phosphate transferase